jgi:hypothetical protein
MSDNLRDFVAAATAAMEKSLVKAHTRTTKSGKVVQVAQHSDKRTKKQMSPGNAAYHDQYVHELEDRKKNPLAHVGVDPEVAKLLKTEAAEALKDWSGKPSYKQGFQGLVQQFTRALNNRTMNPQQNWVRFTFTKNEAEAADWLLTAMIRGGRERDRAAIEICRTRLEADLDRYYEMEDAATGK